MDEGYSGPYSQAEAGNRMYDCNGGRELSKPKRLHLAGAVSSHVVPTLLDMNAAMFSGGRLDDPREESCSRSLVAKFVDLLDYETGGDYETFALDLLDKCSNPERMARTLLEPAARLVGAGWCSDTRDFARVTFAVSRLQRLFWTMVSQYPPARRADPGKLALLASAPGEQHTFGLSIVEDSLRRAGWEVDCCRSGEEAQMYRLASANKYAFVGLSLSGDALMPAFTSCIARLRSQSRNRSVAIVAGGSLPSRNPELAISAGADLVGEDCRAMVRLGEHILSVGRQSSRVQIAAE